MNSHLVLVGLGALLLGCGETADLGEDGPAGPPGLAIGDGSDESSQPDREFVHRFTAAFSLGSLAVAGDFLYLPVAEPKLEAGSNGGTAAATGRLLRCEKHDCASTVVAIHESGSTYFDSVAVVGDQIGLLEIAWPSLVRAALTTCTAPECDDVVRFDELRADVSGVYFERGSVQWSQSSDDATYRCALPGCESPELVVRGIAADQVFRSGDSLVLREEGRVWRLSTESDLLEGLEFGPELRALDPNQIDRALPLSREAGTWVVAVDGEWLYATVNDGCSAELSNCGVARWPVHGYGQRELIYSGAKPIEWMAAFDGELVARLNPVLLEEGDAPRRLISCRVEACSVTARDFPVQGWAGVVTSDTERLYWNEHFSGDPGTSQVRSAPRLAAP